METKRIALICNYQLRSDRIGGMDRFFRAFDTKAKDEGYVVDWFFTSYSGFKFYKELTIISSEGQAIEQFALNYIQKHQKPYGVVITHFTELCTPFYKELKALTNAYVIAVDHNPRPLAGVPFKKRVKNKIKGFLYGRYIDQFVGVSQYTMDCILEDYGTYLLSKTKVIYNGIDTTVFKKRSAPNEGKFIVASHLRPSKGVQDLLQALAQLESFLKNNIQVDIYGEGPLEAELKQQVQKLGLERTVKFYGSTSQLNDLFCNYSYMIQPAYMECFSLSLLESLSANVPVITTQVGGNLELVKNEDNGFVFQAGDVNALVAILKGIVKGERGIINTVNLQIEKNFSLEKMVEEHFNLVRCI
ncbi:glycosyltransferase family 4 protein [Formosa sp. S-31]|uniref:glycosyltransferase family 4 protein n=1 Tax=Formosa sp. S-31 TaxID=2790949 RepID=UPI003EB8D62A